MKKKSAGDLPDQNGGTARLLDVMARLRDPQTGCPWDMKQDFKSLARYTLEEAYEVVEAIENGDHDHLCEELGDLLLQIVFQSQIARERGLFSFDDVAAREAQKMIDRHPHVFGDRAGVKSAEDVLRNWEADKEAKRAEKASKKEGGDGDVASKNISVFDGLGTALPALPRSLKIHQRMARVGFDWENASDIISKIREEIDEVEAEIKSGTSRDALALEIGDVMAVLVNLARHLDIDPEDALRANNRKVERRFRFIEAALRKSGQTPDQVPLDILESLWQEAKKGE